MELGWRDIAMLSMSGVSAVLSVLIGIVAYLLKMELSRKADMSDVRNNTKLIEAHIIEYVRRHSEVTADVGNLYSKLADEKTDRLQAHIDMLVAQNKAQQSVMETLSNITARATGNEKRE